MTLSIKDKIELSRYSLHFPKEFGETFRSIQSRRIDSDYGDYVEIGIDEASDSLNRAQEFVSKAEELLNSIVKDLI